MNNQHRHAIFLILRIRFDKTQINTSHIIGPYDVDFENGWGMWFSASDATTTWTLNTGPVKTLNTGPLGDHTLQGQG